MNEYLDMLGYANEADEGDGKEGGGVLGAIGNAIGSAAKAVGKAIKAVIHFIVEAIKKVGRWIKTGALKLWEKVKTTAGKFSQTMKAWATAIRGKLNELKTWLAQMFQAAKQKVSEKYTAAKNKVADAITWIREKLAHRKQLKQMYKGMKALDAAGLAAMQQALDAAHGVATTSDSGVDADPTVAQQAAATAKAAAAAVVEESGASSAGDADDATESVSNLEIVLNAARTGDFCAAIESLVDVIQYGTDTSDGMSLMELDFAAESALSDAALELSIAL